MDASGRLEHEANTQHDAGSNGDSQYTKQPGHERYDPPSSSSGARAQDSYPGDAPRDSSTHPQQDSRDVSTQHSQREQQGNAEEPLPVSMGATRISSDAVAQANAPSPLSALEGTGQLPKHEESSASSSREASAEGVSQIGEPAWVAGVRSDMGRAMETPFLHPGPQPSHLAQSTPGVSPAAAGAAYARHRLSWQNGWAETDEKVLSRASSPWNTPLKASGVWNIQIRVTACASQRFKMRKNVHIFAPKIKCG